MPVLFVDYYVIYKQHCVLNTRFAYWVDEVVPYPDVSRANHYKSYWHLKQQASYIRMFNFSLLSRGITMIQMFKQFFGMLTVLFSAGEKIAKTADNFATWAEEGSGSFADQARIERKQKLALLNNQTDVQAKQLAATN